MNCMGSHLVALLDCTSPCHIKYVCMQFSGRILIINIYLGYGRESAPFLVLH